MRTIVMRRKRCEECVFFASHFDFGEESTEECNQGFHSRRAGLPAPARQPNTRLLFF
jgi:hypothetical protein